MANKYLGEMKGLRPDCAVESEGEKLDALLDLILIDLYDCDHEKLLDADLIRNGMLEAAAIMGAEAVGDSFHTFKPWGVSGTVTIAESHIAIHTWPEYNFAAVTFETCGNRMNHDKAYAYLVKFFCSKNSQISRRKRGFLDLELTQIRYKQKSG